MKKSFILTDEIMATLSESKILLKEMCTLIMRYFIENAEQLSKNVCRKINKRKTKNKILASFACYNTSEGKVYIISENGSNLINVLFLNEYKKERNIKNEKKRDFKSGSRENK